MAFGGNQVAVRGYQTRLSDNKERGGVGKLGDSPYRAASIFSRHAQN
jgi:hypothetical protein